MFRQLRRKEQSLDIKECEEILKKGTSGVLAVSGDDNYPYAIPLNYVYYDKLIYFHGAKAGHKIDSIKRNPKVSFCVIDQDNIVPEEYTSYFKSVIVFGKIHIIDDEKEKRDAIEILTNKYVLKDNYEDRQKVINRNWQSLCMLKLSIEHISGKKAIELVNKKN